MKVIVLILLTFVSLNSLATIKCEDLYTQLSDITFDIHMFQKRVLDDKAALERLKRQVESRKKDLDEYMNTDSYKSLDDLGIGDATYMKKDRHYKKALFIKDLVEDLISVNEEMLENLKNQKVEKERLLDSCEN